jgi:trigger factor
MQIKKEQLTPTKVTLTVVAEADELASLKQEVVKELGSSTKVSGFRAGKAPAHLIEKQLDPTRLQTEFLDAAVNQLFVTAIRHEKLRPVAQPSISITKFVPFTTLEFAAEVSVIGDITLADYKHLKLAPKKAEVTAKELQEVIASLQARAATRTTVKRAAKLGDELTIDFKGTDAKTGDSIEGGSADDHKLILGSNSFIPGFEKALVGLKAGDSKDVPLTFPKDYAAKELQNRKVTFAVTVKEVQELVEPKFDDAFAATIGPFKTVAEAKANIKKDLLAERERENQAAYDNELIGMLADKSTIPLPAALVSEEIDRMEEEEKRNLTYRGQTWQEHLEAEGVTAEEHRARQQPQAEQRVKGGLAMAEIAEQEKITVSPEDLEVRIMLLKNQYTDPAMQAELEKPENRRDIHNRMMTEKTLDKLKQYATAKP